MKNTPRYKDALVMIATYAGFGGLIYFIFTGF